MAIPSPTADAASSSRVRLLFLLGLCCPAVAFSATFRAPSSPLFSSSAAVAASPPSALRASSSSLSSSFAASVPPTFGPLLRIRGGQQGREEGEAETGDPDDASSSVVVEDEEKPRPCSSSAMLAPVASALRSFGGTYSSLLGSNPILTKSVTACAIFGLSDYAAQKIEGGGDDGKKKTNNINWTRTASTMLVGLLYFGPAAHAWYETIFQILPGTSLTSTLQKAALGQLIFGPSFTCVFFATSLLQSGTFTIGNWFGKIRSDLPGAWAAGLGFWPFVDLVSYSLVPPRYIPLFVNFCSFVWTIYLSMVSNRSGGAEKE